MKIENEKYYIAVNAGDRYPLLKTPQDYTEYFNEALSFGDLFDVLRYPQRENGDFTSAFWYREKSPFG